MQTELFLLRRNQNLEEIHWLSSADGCKGNQVVSKMRDYVKDTNSNAYLWFLYIRNNLYHSRKTLSLSKNFQDP